METPEPCTRIKVKCCDCQLYFVLCSWFPKKHNRNTLHCPECGQCSGHFVIYCEGVSGPIYEEVPGKAKLIQTSVQVSAETQAMRRTETKSGLFIRTGGLIVTRDGDAMGSFSFANNPGYPSVTIPPKILIDILYFLVKHAPGHRSWSDDYRYLFGIVQQECQNCHWSSESMRKENHYCPQCEATNTTINAELSFDNVRIKTRKDTKRRFYIYSGKSQFSIRVEICEPDLDELIPMLDSVCGTALMRSRERMNENEQSDEMATDNGKDTSNINKPHNGNGYEASPDNFAVVKANRKSQHDTTYYKADSESDNRYDNNTDIENLNIFIVFAMLLGLAAIGFLCSLCPHRSLEGWEMLYVLILLPAAAIGFFLYLLSAISLDSYIKRKLLRFHMLQAKNRAEMMAWIIAFIVTTACIQIPFMLNTSIRI